MNFTNFYFIRKNQLYFFSVVHLVAACWKCLEFLNLYVNVQQFNSEALTCNNSLNLSNDIISVAFHLSNNDIF